MFISIFSYNKGMYISFLGVPSLFWISFHFKKKKYFKTSDFKI